MLVKGATGVYTNYALYHVLYATINHRWNNEETNHVIKFCKAFTVM